MTTSCKCVLRQKRALSALIEKKYKAAKKKHSENHFPLIKSVDTYKLIISLGTPNALSSSSSSTSY